MAADPGATLQALRLEATVGSLALSATLEAGPGPLLLAGPNGAGKTSLLLLLLGLLRPSAGRITLGEVVLFDRALGIDLPPERRGLGYLPQEPALFPHLDALGNVEFALWARRPGLRRTARRTRALELLEQLQAGPLAGRRPETLSGGERQKVGLARALAAEPRALLLDEPLAALDATARAQVRGFLAGLLARLRLPALIVTHDPADVAALGERIAVMEAGRIVQVGSAAELGAAPATPFVAALAAGL